MTKWHIYTGRGQKNGDSLKKLPHAPQWRQFTQKPEKTVQQHYFQIEKDEVEIVNAAVYLRRPLLVTGPSGTGKSTLAKAIAYELELGEVLVWPITSRSTVQEALYRYDAVGRLQDANLYKEDKAQSIGNYIQLGPLGTALADSDYQKPRLLLIDEIDKSDIDLPNDLLHLFEEGYFEIPELARYKKQPVVEVRKHGSLEGIEVQQGKIICRDFPIVIITSNGERQLPAPFLRRCLRLEIPAPNVEKLTKIVNAHFENLVGFEADQKAKIEELIAEVYQLREQDGKYIATDQLLNAIYLLYPDIKSGLSKEKLLEFILQEIGTYN